MFLRDMHPLYQRLKELDSGTFERLCFHILKDRHPNANVTHVDGASGDAGIDVFSGDLDGRPIIWQCKSFSNGVGESQKQQIRNSFSTAVKNFTPSRWILCLSIDMDSASTRWFQRFAKSKANVVEIGRWQASDIIHELIHRRTICSRFFPQALFDTMELRQVLTKTGELTDDELVAVSAENVEQFIERLRERDARFNYEVAFSPDGGRSAIDQAMAGLIASVVDDKKTIRVFARDREALRLDPPRVHFHLTGSGAEKIRDLQRTGRPQELGPDEIVDFRSDLSFLGPSASDVSSASRLLVSTAVHTIDPLRTRIAFGAGSDSVTYEYVELQVARIGSEEFELVSIGTLPFVMHLVAGEQRKSGNVTFTHTFKGSQYRDIQKFVRGLDALRATGYLEVYDLEKSARLFRGRISGIVDDPFGDALRRLIDDAVTVSQHYGINLVHPSDPAAGLETLGWLHGLIGGIPKSVESATLSVTKSRGAIIGEYSTFRLIGPPLQVSLFGVTVSTGELIWHFEKAKVPNSQRVAFNGATAGETLDLAVTPAGQVRVFATGVQGVQTASPTTVLDAI